MRGNEMIEKRGVVVCVCMSVWEGVDKDRVNSKQQEDRELHT